MTRYSSDMQSGGANSCDTVGIDDLSVYVPRLFLPTTGEFSISRGIDPAKLIRGIGIERMAIPDAHEDAATMAAMSLLELMKRANLQPEEIGKIYVGTESAVDEAKAIGTYIIGMLEMVFGRGSFQDCSTVEFKSACISTTLALESISYWVAAQQEDKVGVVIASDIARYPLRSSGEYTQGAGSVSLLVRKNPRLVALEQIYGSFTRDENDFFRPLGNRVAVVNGKHSNLCYLDAMEGAFDAFARKALLRGLIRPGDEECITDFIAHLFFHIPYPKMIEYASAAIFRHEWRGLPRWKDIEADIGNEPDSHCCEDTKECQAQDAEFARRFAKSGQFLKAFNSKVKDTAALSRQVGNIYTGSIYLGLASLMELGRICPGERLCFGAYGSGCSALVFSGIVQPEASAVSSLNIWERLEQRRGISLDEYERLHQGEIDNSILAPCQEFALRKIDEQGYRHYEYAN